VTSAIKKRIEPITRDEFLTLSARVRGYAAYMLGCRDDEPNVTDESCPYPDDSDQANEWHEGQRLAVLDAQDSEE
jgi:hypothetical protein